jgi:hypothetical protein
LFSHADHDAVEEIHSATAAATSPTTTAAALLPGLMDVPAHHKLVAFVFVLHKVHLSTLRHYGKAEKVSSPVHLEEQTKNQEFYMERFYIVHSLVHEVELSFGQPNRGSQLVTLRFCCVRRSLFTMGRRRLRPCWLLVVFVLVQ